MAENLQWTPRRCAEEVTLDQWQSVFAPRLEGAQAVAAANEYLARRRAEAKRKAEAEGGKRPG